MIKMLMIGYLGKDATLNETNGNEVINFSVCHTESWTDSAGEKKQKATWADCSYWTKSTGILPYLKKGTQVYVEGTPGARSWFGNDGQANVTLTLRVFSVQLLGGKSDQGNTQADAGQTEATSQKRAPVETADKDTDDLPF
jgi:single-strand DNA-binding protein